MSVLVLAEHNNDKLNEATRKSYYCSMSYFKNQCMLLLSEVSVKMLQK